MIEYADSIGGPANCGELVRVLLMVNQRHTNISEQCFAALANKKNAQHQQAYDHIKEMRNALFTYFHHVLGVSTNTTVKHWTQLSVASLQMPVAFYVRWKIFANLGFIDGLLVALQDELNA